MNNTQPGCIFKQRIETPHINIPYFTITIFTHIFGQEERSRITLLTGNEFCNSEVGDIDMGRLDPLFEDAARLVVIHQQGSTSLIQRKFAIGYNRAGRIMDQLEKAGIVGPTQGSKARDVLCIDDNDLEMRLNNLQ